MPIGIRVKNGSEVARRLQNIQHAFESGEHYKVLELVAMKALADLVRKTPKGWTGMTRQNWVVRFVQGKGYEVTNPSKVMLWLEAGTRAHGPVRARMLFIPLTRDAALGGYRTGMKFGRDFVKAKWVRGIRPMWIVRKEREWVRYVLQNEMRDWLQKVVRRK